MNQAFHPGYSDANFWAKLRRYSQVAGKPVVEKALQLYYSLQSPNTPKWTKPVIIGALAYLIMPADAIPDFLPAVGYTDDLGALVAALATVHLYITDDIKQRASEKLDRWFGKPTGFERRAG